MTLIGTPTSRPEPILLSFGKSLRIRAWGRGSLGRHATLKEPDGRRVGCVEAMEIAGVFSYFLLLA